MRQPLVFNKIELAAQSITPSKRSFLKLVQLSAIGSRGSKVLNNKEQCFCLENIDNFAHGQYTDDQHTNHIKRTNMDVFYNRTQELSGLTDAWNSDKAELAFTMI